VSPSSGPEVLGYLPDQGASARLSSAGRSRAGCVHQDV